MATLIQIPGTYNLLGNLKDVIVASDTSVIITLKLGSTIISKTEHHPIAGMITVDLKEVISSAIVSEIPIFVEHSKSYNLSQFSLAVDTIPQINFYVVPGGVDADITASEFLKSNFLSWRPQTSYVRWLQHMTLSYVAVEASKVKIKGYFSDLTDQTLDFCNLALNKINALNLQYSTLPTLFGGSQPQYIDVWVESSAGTKLTYTQRLVLSNNSCFDDVFIFQNSLGGWDSIVFDGEISEVGASSGSTYEKDGAVGEFDCKLQEKYKKSTGYFIDTKHQKWATELFRSSSKFWIDPSGIVKPIIIDATTLNLVKHKASAVPFTFYPAAAKKYINLDRGEEPQEPIEIIDPDGELFFLVPRLSEFPATIAQEELIIPIQSPYLRKWFKISLGSIKEWILSIVHNSTTGQNSHRHENKPVLDNFDEDTEGTLLYRLKQILNIEKNDKRYLRKDKEDTAARLITFLKGLIADTISSSNFSSGISEFLGTGFKMFIDKDGKSNAVFDRLTIREILKVFEILVNQIRYTGGIQIFGNAGIECRDVEELANDAGYKCYFDTKNDSVKNNFIVDDQAYSKVFNLEGTTIMNHYWRKVIDVGEDYITLSVTDCEAGSGVPSKGDNIVQKGHPTNKSRQAVLIIDQTNGGSIMQYSGIDSYTLEDKNSVGFGVNMETGEPYLISYGDMFIGDRNIDDPDANFITFQKKKGDTKRKLYINATLNIGADSTGLTNFGEWPTETKKIADREDEKIGNVSGVNVVIDTTHLDINFYYPVWFALPKNKTKISVKADLGGSAIPSWASHEGGFQCNCDWTSNGSGWGTKPVQRIINDFCYSLCGTHPIGSIGQRNIDSAEYIYVRGGGKYTFCATDGVTAIKIFTLVEDSHTFRVGTEYAYTLSKVSSITAPVPTLTAAIGGVNESIGELDTYIDGAFHDGIISEAEAIAIGKYINTVNEAYTDLDKTYDVVYGNEYLVAGMTKNNLLAAHGGLETAKNNLITAINTAIADGQTTVAEKNDVDAKFATFNTTIGNFKIALENANKAIQKRIDDISKGYVDDVQVGGTNLLLGSNYLNNAGAWSSLPTPTVEGGKRYVRYGYAWSFTTTCLKDLVVGQQYTWSGMFRSNVANGTARMYLNQNQNVLIYNLTTVWEFRHITFVYNGGPNITTNFLSGGSEAVTDFGYMQIEKGNKATDTSPAVADGIAAIDEKVSEMGLSGRNLLLGSDYETNKGAWLSLPTPTVEGGKRFVRYGYAWSFTTTCLKDLVVGQQYTWSGMFRSNVANGVARMILNNDQNVYIYNLTTTWEFRHITFVYSGGSSMASYFLSGKSGETIDFGYMQIEKGNKWTVHNIAREDTAEGIAQGVESWAKTKGFSIIDGGLIATMILKLMQKDGAETAGMSGEQTDINGNNLPAFWAGGTYAEAIAGTATIVLWHNGRAKIGLFWIEPGGVVNIKDAAGNNAITLTNSPITSLAQFESGSQTSPIYNTYHSWQRGTSSARLPNSIVILNDNTHLTIACSISANVSSPSGALARAEISLYFEGSDGTHMLLGNSGITGPGTRSVNINTTLTLSAGTYTLRCDYALPGWGSASIGDSIMTPSFGTARKNHMMGADGFMNGYGALNLLHSVITNGKHHLTIRGDSDKIDMPGVLAAGSVNNSGTENEGWGAKREASGFLRRSTGTYKVPHKINSPTNYFVSITPTSAATLTRWYVAKYTKYFIVYFYNGSTYANTSFDYAIHGNNT